MNPRVSLLAGVLIVIGAMTVSGVVITGAAQNDEVAAALQALQQPSQPPRAAIIISGSTTPGMIGQGKEQGSAIVNIPVPIGAIQKICAIMAGNQSDHGPQSSASTSSNRLMN